LSSIEKFSKFEEAEVKKQLKVQLGVRAICVKVIIKSDQNDVKDSLKLKSSRGVSKFLKSDKDDSLAV
jgi:hypothetical protein